MTIYDYLHELLGKHAECYNCPVEYDCYQSSAETCAEFLLQKYYEEEY